MTEEERRFIIKKIDKEIKKNKEHAIFLGGFSAITLATMIGVANLVLDPTALTLVAGAFGGLSLHSFMSLIKSISEITSLKKDKISEEIMMDAAEMLKKQSQEEGRSK